MTTVDRTDRRTEILKILPENSTVTEEGILKIGGVSVTEIAERFGTPTYLFDEAGLRAQARRFVEGLRSRWPNSEVLFASKSLPVAAMYALAHEEGLCIDVAGGGELVLALAAGVNPAKIFFHGNAKSVEELTIAVDRGVGTIIVDNECELDKLEPLLEAAADEARAAGEEPRVQDVLLRIIPGVDAHTHASMATGGKDSKFGLPLDQAEQAIVRMNAHPLVNFRGIHEHIGSQILDVDQFAEAVEKISAFGRDGSGASAEGFDTYDVGGGLGVKYTYGEEDPGVDAYLDAVVAAARKVLPEGARLIIEPGRSLVARAGVTLYETLVVKQTVSRYVAVNGGLADQLEHAMTGQRMEAFAATRMNEEWTETVRVVGRQCESGDMLVDGAAMPPVEVGDLIVAATTGAYGYTMANNYNGALKPAVVFVADGVAREVVRRETYGDLLATHAAGLPVA